MPPMCVWGHSKGPFLDRKGGDRWGGLESSQDQDLGDGQWKVPSIRLLANTLSNKPDPWGEALFLPAELAVSSASPTGPVRSPGLRHLPVDLIHGQAASPQPTVAAVAHEGQDGASACAGLHHGLEVEQAALGCRQNYESQGESRPVPARDCPHPRAREKKRETGRSRRGGEVGREQGEETPANS